MTDTNQVHEPANLATQPARRHLTVEVTRVEVDERALERIMPREATAADVHVFARLCKRTGLDPFVKEIYAIPNKRRGGLDYVVGIDGWCRIITQDPRFRGIEFTEEFDDSGALVSIVCTLHVDGWLKPVIVRERLGECTRPTDPWRQMPARMLRHCALKQAGRVAFGLCGITDPDEVESAQDDAQPQAKPAALPPASAASLQAALDAALPGPAHRAAEPAAVGGAPKPTDGPARAAGRKDAPVPPSGTGGDEGRMLKVDELDTLADEVARLATAAGHTTNNTPDSVLRVARKRASEGDGDVFAELAAMRSRLVTSQTGAQTQTGSTT